MSLGIDFLDIQLFISLYCNNYHVRAFFSTELYNYYTEVMDTYYFKNNSCFNLIDNK